jgi:prepilin-type N-terminal cleavage/methylation domain-containing protein
MMVADEGLCTLNAVVESRPARACGNTQRGFSLAELLIAISLTAVIAGMAMLHMPEFYQRFELSDAARQVASDLMRVRVKAIGESQPYKIVFASTGYQVMVSGVSGYTNDGPSVSLPNGTTFGSVPTTLNFNPVGTLPNAASVTVSTGSRSKTVSINELGRVTIQ